MASVECCAVSLVLKRLLVVEATAKCCKAPTAAFPTLKTYTGSEVGKSITYRMFVFTSQIFVESGNGVSFRLKRHIIGAVSIRKIRLKRRVKGSAVHQFLCYSSRGSIVGRHSTSISFAGNSIVVISNKPTYRSIFKTSFISKT